MAETLKLFYDAPRLFTAEARVLFVEGGPEAPVLVLDRTIFYPEGGGQACDLGTIGPAGGGEARAVAAVTEADSGSGEKLVFHAMAGPCSFAPGDAVRLSVDRERRLDYSQQHTAEHLIGSVALRLLGANVVSVRFGPERSLIDFDLPAIPEEDLGAVEEAVERAIAEDHPLRTRLCPPEDAASFPLRRPPPAGEELLRVVEIEGLDFSPCCGLHLGSTGELRLVKLLGAEKYKGMTRLYFVAGARAASDYLAVSRIARDSARILGTSPAELPEAVAREAERRKEAERALLSLERERAAMEVAAARAAADPGEGASSLIKRIYADREAASLMESAKAFAQAGMTALLASLPDLTVQALAPSSSALLGERLKAPLAQAGGKGGGGPASFRAVFPDAGRLEAFMQEAETALSR
jgi:alanyl-tRNA synthetase